MSSEKIVEGSNGGRTLRRLLVADFLGKVVFGALLALIALTAVPYGTAEPWWKALFISVVLLISTIWIIEGLLSRSWLSGRWTIFLPLAALAVLALLQTVPLGTTSNPANVSLQSWSAISADPYQSRFFVLQVLALTLVGLLLLRYVNTERRMRTLIAVVITVIAASALFGILRQTTQRSVGFGLPLIPVSQGYGQFTNRNHFAFLMEMGFGLIVGFILGGGVKRDQALIYLAALVPIWTALVLSGSRGGLVAMMAQVIAAFLLWGMIARQKFDSKHSRIFQLARSLPVRVALVVVLILGVGVGTLWLGGDRLIASIEQTQAEFSGQTDGSRIAVSRNEIWLLTWKMIKAHPVLGVGLGGYWIAVPQYHDASGAMTPQQAHNDYLELLASGGIVGFLIGIWFAVGVVKAVRKGLESPARFQQAVAFGAAVAITGVVVHSLVDFSLHKMINAVVFVSLIALVAITPQAATRSPGGLKKY